MERGTDSRGKHATLPLAGCGNRAWERMHAWMDGCPIKEANGHLPPPSAHSNKSPPSAQKSPPMRPPTLDAGQHAIRWLSAWMECTIPFSQPGTLSHCRDRLSQHATSHPSHGQGVYSGREDSILQTT